MGSDHGTPDMYCKLYNMLNAAGCLMENETPEMPLYTCYRADESTYGLGQSMGWVGLG